MTLPSMPRMCLTKPLLLSIVAVLATGCAARQGVPVGQIPPFEVPPAAEVESTKFAVANALQEEGKDVSSVGTAHARAQRIIDRLARASGAVDFHFPVLIVDAGDDVNAMVADGKTVIIYGKLMTLVPDDDELATVLAHELGHVLGKHHKDTGGTERQEEVSIGSSILGAAANIALSVSGYSGLGSTVGDVTESTASAIGMGAYALAYDRDMEREADHIGLMLMAKAGYDPDAAIRFWSKSDEIFGGSTSLSFFSTHPSNPERLERLQEYLPIALEYYRNSKPSSVTAKPHKKKK